MRALEQCPHHLPCLRFQVRHQNKGPCLLLMKIITASRLTAHLRAMLCDAKSARALCSTCGRGRAGLPAYGLLPCEAVSLVTCKSAPFVLVILSACVRGLMSCSLEDYQALALRLTCAVRPGVTRSVWGCSTRRWA